MLEVLNSRDMTSEDVIRAIEDDIISGKLTPGTQLMEEMLMVQHSTSRNFVQQAIMHLERSGIVRRDKVLGLTVASYSAEEVGHIYDIREMLTRQAALMIALPAPTSLIDTLCEIQARYLQAADDGDLADLHAINEEFHVALFAASGNAYLARTLQDYAALTMLIRFRTLAEPSGLAKSQRDHEMMIALLKGRDSRGLAQLCVEHLQAGKNDYLKRVAREKAINTMDAKH